MNFNLSQPWRFVECAGAGYLAAPNGKLFPFESKGTAGTAATVTDDHRVKGHNLALYLSASDSLGTRFIGTPELSTIAAQHGLALRH